MSSPHRFPPPWSVEETAAWCATTTGRRSCMSISRMNRGGDRRRNYWKPDEARRIAVNIAKLLSRRQTWGCDEARRIAANIVPSSLAKSPTARGRNLSRSVGLLSARGCW